MSTKNPSEHKANSKTLKKYKVILTKQVIDQQTLQVDAVSGATLTSKAVLQAVENALLQAIE